MGKWEPFLLPFFEKMRYTGRSPWIDLSMNTPLTERPEADLLDEGFHRIKVQDLLALCNPFEAWGDAGKPIEADDVLACLAAGKEALTDTPSWYENARRRTPLTQAELRERHIQKVAYFVKHPATNPISVDVGVPGMGCIPDHLVDDGNHRFAGAILRGDNTIRVQVGGDLEYARELGLWNPNNSQKELCKRWGVPVSPKRSAPRMR